MKGHCYGKGMGGQLLIFMILNTQVYTLMKFDSYPRFLKSDVYRQSLVADLEGAPLPGEEGEEPREFKGRGSFFWKVKSIFPQCSSMNYRICSKVDVTEKSFEWIH